MTITRDPRLETQGMATAHPFVLFPVRLETRWFALPGETRKLRIRVYPDEILADGFDSRLSPGEIEQAKDYWRSCREFPDREAAAWQILLQALPPARALWAIEATRPTNAAGAPVFPASITTRGSWSRPGSFNLLPDRWLFRLVRADGTLLEKPGNRIAQPLTADPAWERPAAGQTARSAGDAHWSRNFAAAEAQGMAVTFDGLTDSDWRNGFARLLVLGVRTGKPASEAPAALEGLLRSHALSRGVSLLAPGFATKRTASSPSEGPAAEAESSFRSLRGPGAAGASQAGSDARSLARLLGVSPEVARRFGNETQAEFEHRRSMNRVVWAATLGYFLEQMVTPSAPEGFAKDVRDFFVDWVSGRGHAPAFRIGNVPYGVLPVTRISRTVALGQATPFEQSLAKFCFDLFPVWKRAGETAPNAFGTTPADTRLLDILRLEPVSRKLFVRRGIGPEAGWNWMRAMGRSQDEWMRSREEFQRALSSLLVRPIRPWRVFGMEWRPGVDAFNGVRVAPSAPGRGPLGWLSSVPPSSVWRLGDDFEKTAAAGGEPARRILLNTLARRSYLLEATWAARRVLGPVEVPPWIESEFERKLANKYEDPESPFRDVRPSSMGMPPVDFTLPKGDAPFAQFRQALRALDALDPRRLEALLAESLDLVSHRLDAWIEGIAAKRLADMRDRFPGSWMGAYGWLEKLKPSFAPASKGWVHAPSMHQALTAAILGTAPAGLVKQVSSDALAGASELHALLRQGGSAAWAICDRFRSALLGPPPPTAQQVDSLYTELARLFPVEPGSGWPFDGLAALNDFRAPETTAKWTSNATLAVGRPAMERVSLEWDGLSRLLLGESVHQLAMGNLTGAASALDALGRGGTLPELEHLRQRASGVSVRHRVALAFREPDPKVPDEWGAIGTTPRSIAEPRLDRWLAGLFGAPSRFVAEFRSPGLAGTPSRVTLAETGLRPIDVLALIEADPSGQALLAVMSTVLWERAREARYAPDPIAPDSELGGLLALGTQLSQALASARPLRAPDLSDPGASAAAPAGDAELVSRIEKAATAATGAIGEFRAGWSAGAGTQARIDACRALRKLLAADAKVPFDRILGSARANRVDVTLEAELRVREWGRKASNIAYPASATAADKLRIAWAHHEATFGKALPPIPHCPELATAAASASAGTPALGAYEVERWVQVNGSARETLRRWRVVGVGAAASGGGTLGEWSAVQPKPPAPAAMGPWIARSGSASRKAGFLPRWSLAFCAAAGSAPLASGLLLDEWTELQPYGDETTGLAFHFDHPLAEAPQCVLLAVPESAPSPSVEWPVETLWGILGDTLDLAKARLAKSPRTSPLAQIGPPAYVAENTAGRGLSTRLSDAIESPGRTEL